MTKVIITVIATGFGKDGNAIKPAGAADAAANESFGADDDLTDIFDMFKSRN